MIICNDCKGKTPALTALRLEGTTTVGKKTVKLDLRADVGNIHLCQKHWVDVIGKIDFAALIKETPVTKANPAHAAQRQERRAAATK